MLLRQESSVRYDISCQVSATPTPGPKTAATTTPTIKPVGTKTPVPSNTPTPTNTIPFVPSETPTVAPTPTTTPNAQILSANNLISSINTTTFDSSGPVTIASGDLATGEQLVAITRRPRNNMLYGLAYHSVNGSVQLYLISPRTGRAQSVSGTAKTFVNSSAQLDRIGVNSSSIFSMDVNPNTDRIRVVVDNGDNFRMNPNTGGLFDGDYGGAADSVPGTNKDGDINGLTSSVQAIAHTNTSVITSNTTLYSIDAVNDAYYIQNPANEGTQVNSMPLSFNVDSVFGFDIGFGVNAPASNTPVASGKGAIGIKISSGYELGVLNLADGRLSTDPLPTSIPTPISLAVTANKVSSYPIILLTNGGTSITRLSSGSVGTMSTSNLTGVHASEILVGIDFRPANGKLIGLGINDTANTGTLYVIDPQSGAASNIGAFGGIALVSTGGVPINFSLSDAWGIDINPKTDRVRVVTSSGLNFRINATTGAPTDGDATDGTINPDSALSGMSTGASDAAYTNSVLGTTITTQYNLDTASQALLIQSFPEAGVQDFALALTAIDNTPLSFSLSSGLDISNEVFALASNQAAPSGKAVAVLTVGGVQGIYEIDLATGRTELVGTPAVTNIVDVAVGYREVY